MKPILACLILLLFFCCNSIDDNSQLVFNICDEDHKVKKPYWWDTFDLVLNDSLLDKCKTAKEYIEHLNETDYKLRNEFYAVHPYSYRVKFKLEHYFNQNKSSSLNRFIRFSDYHLSYELSATFKSILFNCEKEKKGGYGALIIGDEYFNAGLLEQSISYYKKATDLFGEKTGYYPTLAKEKYYKLKNIDDRKSFLKEHNKFRFKIDSLLQDIEVLRTKDRLKALYRSQYNLIEKKFPELGMNYISMFEGLSDYDLALHYLVFEDDYTIRKLNNHKMIESIKESFIEYSNDPDFKISEMQIDNPRFHSVDRDEWVILFAAEEADWWGAAEFVRFEYQNSINMIE